MSRITKGDDEPDQPPKLREVARFPERLAEGDESSKVVPLPVEEILTVKPKKTRRRRFSPRTALFTVATGMVLWGSTIMGVGMYLMVIGNPNGSVLFTSSPSLLGTGGALFIAGANKEEEDSDEDSEAK